MTIGLFRRGVCALIAMLAPAAPVSAADGVNVSGSYAVSVAGFPIGRFDFDAQLSDRAYRLSGSGRLTGLAQLLSNGHGAAESWGAFQGGRAVPAHYGYSEVAGQKAVSISMDMGGGDVRRLSLAPPLEPSPERIPVTEAHKHGVVDPLSGLLFQVRGDGPLLSPAVCARSIPMFDGRQRFDVELSYAGLREVRAPRGYQGPVLVCRAVYRPIAGHRPAKKEVQQMQANPTIEAWLAPIQGTRILVPYRISIRTVLGDAVAEADRFELRPAAKQAAAQ